MAKKPAPWVKEDKQKWKEEKTEKNSTSVLHKQMIVGLNVGGTHYTTSHSTLTKYPESMLGVMFSGRHDMEAMKCSDGSFFIDRDGTHFRHILNYLRDGEEVVQWFPQSFEALHEIAHEARYYQLGGLVDALTPIITREFSVISQAHVDIHVKGTSSHGYYWESKHDISYKDKSMKNLTFIELKFDHLLSFINCNLNATVFHECTFLCDVTFKDCILDDTSFTGIKSIHHISFINSKTDKTYFDSGIRASLLSAGKIC